MGWRQKIRSVEEAPGSEYGPGNELRARDSLNEVALNPEVVSVGESSNSRVV
ncbi:hypothetical protein ABW19_dt0202541 [Dactylella cylindrospora]|nr:hypothetical protein ABW19_dt0202541 [Dactylella cylindrospora]